MKSIEITRRNFLLGSLTLGSVLMFSKRSSSAVKKNEFIPVGMQVSQQFREDVFRLKLKRKSDSIRLLQLTDLHFNPLRREKKVDEDTKNLVRKLIELTEPDLVAITGDVWNENPFGKGLSFLESSVEFFGTLGVPWLYTWGNHDMLSDYSKGHDILARGNNSLYRGGLNRGNYEVVIENEEGKDLWRLICINTSNYGFLEEQLSWLRGWIEKNKSNTTPTFMIFHIPIFQYHTIWEEKIASGVKFEKVCYEKEEGSAFETINKVPGLKACICGHDHVNDYSGLYKGIDLIYGRATGRGGYGSDLVPKGGKLYTLFPSTGEYDWASITDDNERWHPPKNMRIEKKEELPWLHKLSG
ncbi:MAG: metallophosphoesterase [Candidatus Hydrogenedentes bacterium]|nr:metallophosphoesterase [Candidatus Hydrogenedentota bacterium]